MSAALYAAAAFTKSVLFLVKEDGRGRAVEVVNVFPITRQSLSAPKKRILAVLAERRRAAKSEEEQWFPSMGALAKAVNLSRSSTSDHIKVLSDWGYVEVDEGRPTRVRSKELGEAVLEMARKWKRDRDADR